MSSKLLKKGSEMYGKKKGDADLGLLAEWAGKDNKTGDGIIASFSKGRQYEGQNSPNQMRRAAPLRDGKAITKDMSSGVFGGRDGYGKV